jgi:hypothetical protein
VHIAPLPSGPLFSSINIDTCPCLSFNFTSKKEKKKVVLLVEKKRVLISTKKLMDRRGGFHGYRKLLNTSSGKLNLIIQEEKL